MAHFAEIDNNNIVIRVIVIENSELIDDNGKENELKGIAFCKSHYGENTKWVQTSYNSKFRGAYASGGFIYDAVKDIFVESKPFPLYTDDGEPTIPKPEEPNGYIAVWDKEDKNWVLTIDRSL